MKIIYSDKEKLHHPQKEWSEGKLIAYSEKNIRAEIIKNEVIKKGMGSLIIQPNEYPLEHIKAVADPVMVDFIKSCENLHKDESVFPHVFPYRDFTPEFTEHPKINLRKAGCYCFDVGIEIDQNTFKAAKASVDVALTGADLIIDKKEKNVFALTRPPGHHAGYGFFGGYCIFNNAAVATQKLAMALCTVAILDIDFHHGNGTQDIFYDQPEILYVSIHGNPRHYFPYFSGFEDEKGYRLGLGANMNIPLDKGTDNNEYRKHLRRALKRIKEFEPEVLVISLGFDTYIKDPIGEFNLTTEFYKEIALMCGDLQIPILTVLEGGYDIKSLQKNGYSFIEGLAELE